MLYGEASMPPFNLTHVVRIPKVDTPKKASEFRPINLCSIMYKVVTKTLANRLKSALHTVISDEQSAETQAYQFVPRTLGLT